MELVLNECTPKKLQAKIISLTELIVKKWPEVQFRFECIEPKKNDHACLRLLWNNGPTAARLALTLAAHTSFNALPQGDGSWMIKDSQLRVVCAASLDPARAALALIRALPTACPSQEIASWMTLDFRRRSESIAKEYEKMLNSSLIPTQKETALVNHLLEVGGFSNTVEVFSPLAYSTLTKVLKKMNPADLLKVLY